MPTGIQVLNNPQFDQGATGWTLAQGSGSTVTISNGQARLVRPAGAASAAITQNVLVVGAPYVLRAFISRNVGAYVFGANAGGQQVGYTTPGLKQINIAAAGAAQLGVYLQTADREVDVEWVTAHRLDVNMSKVVLTLRDYDGDKKQTSVELGPVTDGTSYTTREAQAAAIRDAVNAVAGNIASYDFLAQSTEPNNVNTATPVFQTHIRWIVELFDSVTGDGPYAFDIPTADLSNADLVLPSSVEHDPAAAEWIALKAALNGIVINPRTGSTMTVGRIYLEE